MRKRICFYNSSEMIERIIRLHKLANHVDTTELMHHALEVYEYILVNSDADHHLSVSGGDCLPKFMVNLKKIKTPGSEVKT